MKIKSLSIQNFRSFENSGEIQLSNINILIGANNSGKSSILRALHHLQNGLNNIFGDVRVGATQAIIDIQLQELNSSNYFGISTNSTNIVFKIKLESYDRRSGGRSAELKIDNELQSQGNLELQSQEPNHFIIPFFSKRKPAAYLEDIREANVFLISSDMSNLAAKLSRLANPNNPVYERYSEACKAILGFVVTTIPSQNGQRPGIYLPDLTTIPIEQMGEGVPNIVSLLANLAVSEDKLFLIEEPENDLHPQALKALLDLIALSSKKNQFVISTHSNIVVTHMCSVENNKLFKITSEKGKLPTKASIEEVGNSSSERVQVLQELGYSFSDYDLWEGWILLEESSAERVIRDFLIPWFTPKISRLKTVAASGIDTVEPMFKDLFRVVLFTHLQQTYSELAWVRVDGDDVGKQSIQRLRESFSSMPKEHFSTFDKPQFEQYYPRYFQERITETLIINDKKKQREAKRILLNDVINWLDQDHERGRRALEESATSVIDELKLIEKQFLATKSN